MCVVRQEFKCIFFPYGYLVFPAIFVSKGFPLPHWIALVQWQKKKKINEHIYVWQLLASLFCSLDLYVYHYTNTTLSWSKLQGISLEIKQCNFTNCAFFFKDSLGILGPLYFYVNFRIRLCISSQNPPGILVGISLSVWTYLERTDIQMLMNLSIHECISPLI